eukprot:UN17136
MGTSLLFFHSLIALQGRGSIPLVHLICYFGLAGTTGAGGPPIGNPPPGMLVNHLLACLGDHLLA